MDSLTPQIITKATITSGNHIPAVTQLKVESLYNHLLPALGFSIAIEFTEDGWIFLMGSISDFQLVFSEPSKFPKDFYPDSFVDDCVEDSGEQFSWKIDFIKIPPESTEEELVEIIAKFYDGQEGIAAGVFHTTRDKSGALIYEVTQPSLACYISILNQLVEVATKFEESRRK